MGRGWKFILCVCAVVSVLAAGAGAAVAVSSRSIATQTSVLGPPPPWAELNPCLPVIALPHAVSVGKPITAHAGPEDADLPGCATVKGESWHWIFHNEPVPGCAVNATKCVLRAHTPTAEWAPLCADGVTGGVTPCDYVQVPPTGPLH